MTTLTNAAGTFEISATTYFTLNLLPSHCEAWNAENVSVLSKPSPKRGSDPDIIPNSDGTIGNVLWRDGRDHTFTLYVKGKVDTEGDNHPSVQEGIITNLELMAEYWGAIPNNADSTYELVYYRKDGTTRTGDVQILDFDWNESKDNLPFLAVAMLRIYIPAGQLGAPV